VGSLCGTFSFFAILFASSSALCGRIGIMVSGALQCLGSVQHLKSRYGQGYLMEINAKEISVPKVKAFVEKSYPGSSLDEAHAGRLKYRLPQQGLSLSSVFSSMEAQKNQLDIVDYSISQCSLESIFISRVREQKEHEPHKPIGSP
jgi:ABC-type multidrug transport system ATPase subunit